MLKQAGAAQMKAGTSNPAWQVYRNTVVSRDGSGTPIRQRVMLPPYGDDPRDQSWIKAGFRYYDSHK